MSETYTLSYNRLKLPGRTFFLIKPQRICAEMTSNPWHLLIWRVDNCLNCFKSINNLSKILDGKSADHRIITNSPHTMNRILIEILLILSVEFLGQLTSLIDIDPACSIEGATLKFATLLTQNQGCTKFRKCTIE